MLTNAIKYQPDEDVLSIKQHSNQSYEKLTKILDEILEKS